MKIAGVIAEYNPFHRGHAYHLLQTRKRSQCDYVVVCMTGSFTQRGEPALLSKWERARMALLCGADAVFELPAIFAVRTADAFARGGVGILHGLGVDLLSFGSESTEPGLFDALCNLRYSEPESVQRRLQALLGQGCSHAQARGLAYAEALNVKHEALNKPNLTLAVEYRNELRRLGSPMDILPIDRVGDYHDTIPNAEAFASASSIRGALFSDRRDWALAQVPDACRPSLERARGLCPPDSLLLYKLRGMTLDQLRALPDVREGLEYRIRDCANRATSCDELIALVKCKRYTRARLTRLFTYALLDWTQALLAQHATPQYARLLGFRSDATALLTELKKRSSLPLLSKASELRNYSDFSLECRCSDLRALLCVNPKERTANVDLTAKLVVV